MRTWLSLALAVLLLVAATGCAKKTPPEDECVVAGNADIDYSDVLFWGGTMYEAGYARGGRLLTEADLGAQVGQVRCRLSGNVSDPAYKPKNGDAAFLQAGAPIYSLKNYDPRFRLAVRRGGELVLFETDLNENARRGSDMLDLRGKVAYITVTPAGGNWTSVIPAEARVRELVEAVMTAPTFPGGERGGKATEGATVTVRFHLTDGTVSARPYWPSSGLLLVGPGLHMPDSFRKTVQEVLDK